MLPKSTSSRSIGPSIATPLPHDQIRQGLQKIIASPEFLATRQQRNFLTFVVAETLAGRSNNLKGYTVATQVFGRAEDFNASVDPIVSIQANKLRRALERYYLVDGSFDLIRIDIPKGTYIPTFVRRDVAEMHTAATSTVERPVPENSWPTILILPFKNLTGDPEQDFLSRGISTELAIEISRFENIQVLFPRDGIPTCSTLKHPRFVLSGELYKDKYGTKLGVFLNDTTSGIQLWGDICKTTGNLADLYSFREQVAMGVATKVCGEFGIITKAMCRETKNKLPDELSTYEAILRFWEYEQNTNHETFGRAFAALTHAEKLEPDCCLILGCLAILYGTIYSLDIPGFENPLDKAAQYAERAATLNPNNQRVLAIHALIRFTSNNLSAAAQEAHRALELNPHSLFVLDGLAWILTLSGDWQNGPRLAKRAINLNPFHRAVAHDALWVNYLRQGKYDLAYEESCSHQRSNLFWDPLMKASSLALGGHKEESAKWAEKLLELKPDFPVKGRMLVGNYIKFDEVFDRVLDGLARAGVGVE